MNNFPDKAANNFSRDRGPEEEAFEAIKIVAFSIIKGQMDILEKLERGEIENIPIDDGAGDQEVPPFSKGGVQEGENALEQVISFSEAISREEKRRLEILQGVIDEAYKVIDFAVAISSGEEYKMLKIREAVDEAFQEIQEKAGSLPREYDKIYWLIMEKLNKWIEN